MNNSLEGKVIIVTGGTGSIGLAISKKVLYLGGLVVCGCTSAEKAIKARQLLLDDCYHVSKFLVCKLDVCNDDDIVCVVNVAERFGEIRGLVNCAGRNLKKPFLDTTINDFRAIADVNLYGSVRMAQAVCKKMIDQKTGGVIVNICSVTSFRALSGVTTYAASKAALLALTRQMAVEMDLVRAGIRTIAVAPGFVPTDQNRAILASSDRGSRILMGTPQERYGTPQEVANVVAFLLSDEASFMNGTCVEVDGGFMANGVSEAMQGGFVITPKLLDSDDVTQLDGCEIVNQVGVPSNCSAKDYNNSGIEENPV